MSGDMHKCEKCGMVGYWAEVRRHACVPPKAWVELARAQRDGTDPHVGMAAMLATRGKGDLIADERKLTDG